MSMTPYPSSLEFNAIGVMENNTVCYAYHARDKHGEMKVASVLTDTGEFKNYTDKDFYSALGQRVRPQERQSVTAKVVEC